MKIETKRMIFVIFILSVAFLLRIYNITKFTEFLGDQGRDALVIRELVKDGKLPIVGPTVGAGHYTGPFYYYLIAPSLILFGFNPIASAVEMSLIGTVAIGLFLYIATALFSFPIACGVSVLWALSPLMIIQDRRLWNPTPIPFFILLLIGSLLWISKKKYWAFVTAAFASAALIQLHYVNGISLCLAGLCFISIVYTLVKQGKGKTIIPWFIASIGVFVILLYPFIFYEAQHGFTDMKGSLMTLSFKGGQIFSKRLYVNTFIDICSKLVSYIVAIPWKIPLIIISAFLLLGNLVKSKFISYILVTWLIFGIGCLSFYKDTFQSQYAYQFIPIVFLLLVGVINNLWAHRANLFIIGLGISSIIISWSFTNPYKINNPDIPRIVLLTEAVMKMAEERPFSFTLINSRSYTDFHVRYYLLLKNAKIVPVDENSGTLFVLCEEQCGEETVMKPITVMCHADYCPIDLPIIQRNDWTYISTTEVGSSAIYTYKR